MGGNTGKTIESVISAPSEQARATQIAEEAQVQTQAAAPEQPTASNITDPITDKEYRDAGFSGNPLIKNLGERAINGYTGQDYGNTNAILGGYYKEKYGTKPTAKQIKQANLQENVMNRALDRLPSKSGVTYRGMSNEALKTQLLGAIGGEISMKGFQSTSTKKSVADDFAGSNKSKRVMLVVNGKNGKSIDKFSKFKGVEAEVLFKSNTKFKIDRYDSKTDTFHITEI